MGSPKAVGHSAEDLLENCSEGWKKHTAASLIALSKLVCMWENPSLCPPASLRAVIPPYPIIIHTLLAPVLLLCSLTPLPACNHAVITDIPWEEGSRCSSFPSIPCRAAGEDGKAVHGGRQHQQQLAGRLHPALPSWVMEDQ